MDQIYPKKEVSDLKQKSEHRHWTLHIRISLGTKFHLKLRIMIFSTKFPQKGCFPSRIEKVNTTIEFRIFELDYVPNFTLNWQFRFFFFFFFLTKFARKGYFRSKTEKLRLCVRPWSLFTILNFSAGWSTDTTVF